MNLGVQGIKSVFQCPNLGLLIARLAVGVVLVIAGWNKIAAGADVLHAVGANVKYVGLTIGSNNAFTLFFGSVAAGVELICGALLILGLLFRTSAALLFLTMLVATSMTVQASGGDLLKFGYPMVVGLVLLALLFTGPGRFAIQKD